MNIENLVKGLQLIVEEVSEGKFTIVPSQYLENAKTPEPEKVVEPVTEEPKNDTVTEEVNKQEAEEEIENVTGDLQNKTVAELRQIAKEMGLPIRGSKSTILGRILEAQDQQAEEENLDEEYEEVEEPFEDSTEEVEEVEEEEPADENEELQAKLEQLDVEDLADLCAEVSLSTKGKKQGLIARLMKAHMDGDIDLSDLEFEEEDETEEDDGIDVKEVLEEQPLKVLKSIAKECDVKVALKDKKDVVIEKLMGADEDALAHALVEAGIIELADEEPVEEDVEEPETDKVDEEVTFEGSEVRQEKCAEIFDETFQAIKDGDIEESDLKEFFEDRFKGNKSELKKIANTDFDELAFNYCTIVANLVDDDGDEVELEEPYMVGDTPYCCGVPMKQLDDTTYLCEIDGEEVELEG
nr:MAG TPA: Ku70 repair protein, Protein-DNA interaction [Caudoviricetes sp.]